MHYLILKWRNNDIIVRFIIAQYKKVRMTSWLGSFVYKYQEQEIKMSGLLGGPLLVGGWGLAPWLLPLTPPPFKSGAVADLAAGLWWKSLCARVRCPRFSSAFFIRLIKQASMDRRLRQGNNTAPHVWLHGLHGQRSISVLGDYAKVRFDFIRYGYPIVRKLRSCSGQKSANLYGWVGNWGVIG